MGSATVQACSHERPSQGNRDGRTVLGVVPGQYNMKETGFQKAFIDHRIQHYNASGIE